MDRRKDVLTYQHEKGRKLFLVSLRLERSPGAMAKLARALDGARCSVHSGFLSAPDADGRGNCSFYVEAIEGRPPADALRRAIESAGVTSEVAVREARSGVLVDSLNFPLHWSTGGRAIMMRTQFFAMMETEARALLSSGADVLLYQLGSSHGRSTWDDLLEAFRVKDLSDLREAVSIYSAVGWGVPEVLALDFEGRSALVRILHNFECESLARREGPASNFFRGHLAGLFASLFRAPVRVTETSCVAKGDPCCEFAVASEGPSPRPSRRVAPTVAA